MQNTLHVALAGNPNVGKSTIFNALTNGRQHVGNWPGKTVERAVGSFRTQDMHVELVDLPGAYSLSAYSPEELIARDYLVRDRPDIVIDVVDAANLERNLYLTIQILETGAPLMIALTMTDLANSYGIKVDCAALSKALGGAMVVPCVAHQGRGIAELRAGLLQHYQRCCGKEEASCPHCH